MGEIIQFNLIQSFYRIHLEFSSSEIPRKFLKDLDCHETLFDLDAKVQLISNRFLKRESGIRPGIRPDIRPGTPIKTWCTWRD